MVFDAFSFVKGYSGYDSVFLFEFFAKKHSIVFKPAITFIGDSEKSRKDFFQKISKPEAEEKVLDQSITKILNLFVILMPSQ